MKIELSLWPLDGGRASADPTVPPEIREDYREACAVLDISPQSSGALARRILQRVLLEYGNVDKTIHKNLYQQIEAVLPGLPSYVSEDLHFLRGIGNFAAHSQEDSAGTIIKVDREEAEATLEVLERLFDHYFVAPAKSRAARDKFKDNKVAPTGNTHLINKIG